MFVYEVALELGISSGELVQRAAALGVEGLSPASSLTPDQVALLRHHLAPAAPAAPASVDAPPADAWPGTAPTGRGGGRGWAVAAAAAVAVVVLGAGAYLFLGRSTTDAVTEDSVSDELALDLDVEAAPAPAPAPDTTDTTDTTVLPGDTEPTGSGAGGDDLDEAVYCPASVTYVEVRDELETAAGYAEAKAVAEARGEELLDALATMRESSTGYDEDLATMAAFYGTALETLAASSDEADFTERSAAIDLDEEALAAAQFPICSFDTVGERIEG